MKIQVCDEGIIYRNAKPHLRSRHAYFPSLAVLPNGSIFAGFDIGSAFEAADVRSFYAISGDGGRSWSDPAPVVLPEFSRPFSSTCRFSASPDGHLIGIGALWDRSREDEGMANPKTGGFVETHPFLVRAEASSLSWDGPRFLSLPVNAPLEICSAPIFAPGGDWLWPASIWRDWEGRAPLGEQAVVIRSRDRGDTWSSWNAVMDGRSQGLVFWEIKMIRFADGRLLSVCWTHDTKAKRDLPVHYALSQDDGQTFTTPASTGLIGQTCTPVASADGHILSLYRRTDRPGLWAQISELDGNTWRNSHELLLWAGEGYTKESSDGAHATIERMSTLRFGLPTAVLLPEGGVLAAFWCMEDAVSIIRYFRIQITS